MQYISQLPVLIVQRNTEKLHEDSRIFYPSKIYSGNGLIKLFVGKFRPDVFPEPLHASASVISLDIYIFICKFIYVKLLVPKLFLM